MPHSNTEHFKVRKDQFSNPFASCSESPTSPLQCNVSLDYFLTSEKKKKQQTKSKAEWLLDFCSQRSVRNDIAWSNLLRCM